jgi:L-fucose isomerase-like protein
MLKIKIATFKSKLQHSNQFDKEIQSFLSAIEQGIHTSLEFAPLEDYDCDLKLIFIQTGGSEGLFLENIALLKEPYYLLTNGGNNSLAASLEILTYLNQQNKKGEIIHGSISYIVNRIKELASIEKAIHTLKTTKLGVMGQPSNWLISSVPKYSEVKKILGIELVDIPLENLETKAKAPHFSSISPNEFPESFAKDMHASIQIYDAMLEIIKQNNLQGATLRCFDLLTSLKATGCLALAKLNKEGYIGTCEGDIMAMISMYIVKLLTGDSSFQANPSRIDVEHNSVVFAHCTIPLDMIKDSYKLDTHFESGIGVAIKGELKTGNITVFRMSSDLKHYFVSKGILMNNLNESNLCRTQINVRLNKSVKELLKHPCGNHHIILYGDYEELIEQFMNTLLA